GRRQAESFGKLAAVEIQDTFYRPVSLPRARRWRTLAPPDFRFAVKASQFITHEASSPTYRRAGREIPAGDRAVYGNFQDTAAVREGWDATRAGAEVLRAPVHVFQPPTCLGPSEANRNHRLRH